MSVDNYAPCPCGSGKKFKWCCQPIYADIDRAYRLDEQGQHEAAQRAMDELTAKHPANPEAWGRKAQLLYARGRVDEAEAALEKAVEINPDYPFGHYLRGMFRQQEGEVPGALLLFRKAAELYDPDAKDVLGPLYEQIGDNEFNMNRPVAARAALAMALRCTPTDQELRQKFDGLFGEESPLPASARREYALQDPPAGADAERRRAWDGARERARLGKFSETVAVFQEAAQAGAADAAAWYNLALARAWQGENRAALEALENYVEREADEAKAGTAAALGEVLRCGFGMDDQANYLEHSVIYQIRDGRALGELIQGWDRDGRLVVTQASEQSGLLEASVLDAGSGLAGAATQLRGLAARLWIIADILRLSHPNAATLARVRDEVEARLGASLSAPRSDQRPAALGDILIEALAVPVKAASEEEARRRVGEHVQRFFEEVWAHRPLRSLGLVAPADAAGRGPLRKTLIGAVQFLRECAGSRPAFAYDFDRLRRTLGLATEPPAGAGEGAPDAIAALNAEQLAGLPAETLGDEALEEAYRSAVKLDARDLAARFAQTLVARPARAGGPDRFPWYSFLVQRALAQGDTAAALDYLNAGEQHDCQHNEGRRRNDYELRRGQVHANCGESAEARDVFERLIARVPTELRYRASAAEALLSARQPAPALQFAEEGLAQARKQNDRDSEGHFLELVSAAKRLHGRG
jgi:tetratricopeptide (TPR) repeat protein